METCLEKKDMRALVFIERNTLLVTSYMAEIDLEEIATRSFAIIPPQSPLLPLCGGIWHFI